MKRESKNSDATWDDIVKWKRFKYRYNKITKLVAKET